MCEICDKLKHVENKKCKVKIDEDLLIFEPSSIARVSTKIIMELVLDDDNGEPDFSLHTSFEDRYFNWHNLVFDDLHYCPRCGKKIV